MVGSDEEEVCLERRRERKGKLAIIEVVASNESGEIRWGWK